VIRDNSRGRLTFDVVNYGLIALLCVVFLLPLWHVIVASVSDPVDLMQSSGILLWPLGKPTLEGYRLVLNDPSILSGYANTLIYVAGATLVGALLTLLAGYVTSRKHLRLRRPLIVFIVFTLIFNGGLIPTYMVVRAIGFVGTRWALLIPGTANAFFIMIMKTAFEQIPASYEESAKMDGAEPLTILIRILVPLVKATVAVVIMFTLVLQWNSWFPASIYIATQRSLWPLQLVMREILVQNEASVFLVASDAVDSADFLKNLVKYSVVIVGTLPVLAVYPFAQRYFVTGAMLGGVKG
jgi:putative aldouronate transport system permease protein